MSFESLVTASERLAELRVELKLAEGHHQKAVLDLALNLNLMRGGIIRVSGVAAWTGHEDEDSRHYIPYENDKGTCPGSFELGDYEIGRVETNLRTVELSAEGFGAASYDWYVASIGSLSLIVPIDAQVLTSKEAANS